MTSTALICPAETVSAPPGTGIDITIRPVPATGTNPPTIQAAISRPGAGRRLATPPGPPVTMKTAEPRTRPMTRRVESHRPSARTRSPSPAAPLDMPVPASKAPPRKVLRVEDASGEGITTRPLRAGSAIGLDLPGAVGAEDPLDAGMDAGHQVEERLPGGGPGSIAERRREKAGEEAGAVVGGGEPGDRPAIDVVGVDEGAVGPGEASAAGERGQIGHNRGGLEAGPGGAQLPAAVAGVRYRPGEAVHQRPAGDRRPHRRPVERRIEGEEEHRRPGDVRGRHAGAVQVAVQPVPLDERQAVLRLEDRLDRSGERRAEVLTGRRDVRLDPTITRRPDPRERGERPDRRRAG